MAVEREFFVSLKISTKIQVFCKKIYEIYKNFVGRTKSNFCFNIKNHILKNLWHLGSI
jgi:hypothetical protein